LDFGDVGTVIGEVTIRSGGTLQLNGTVDGNINVSPKAVVELNGTAHGNIHNLGGVLNVRGVLNGKVLHQSGTTTYFRNAILDGVRISQDHSV
jgi:cytoskeletal protein CcmA (bactofilin family)